MSDEVEAAVFVLHCVSGCYAEVHISWEIFEGSAYEATSNNSNVNHITIELKSYSLLWLEQALVI